jgi:predicted PurR-regulated permease PerM
MSDPDPRGSHRLALRLVVAVLVAGALWVFLPLWPYLVLAVWFASFARPLLERFAKRFRGRRWAAAILTLLLFVLVLGPLVFIGIALTADAIELGRRVSTSESGQSALQAIVSPSRGGAQPIGIEIGPTFDVPSILRFAQENGQRAMSVMTGVAGVAANVVLGLFVFFAAAYVALVEGPRAYAWLEAHTPLARRHQERLARAFIETGRGLAVGVGLTGLAQGLLATLAYMALGVPRAMVLGVVTLFASLVPSIGTAFVWVPVSIGLALSGQTTQAIILFAFGAVVVSSADNVLRPLFAKWGQLQMHGFLVLLAMLGGVLAFGGWGLLLGPLLARLAIEALRIFREEDMAERPRSADQAPSSSAISSSSSTSSSSVRTDSSTTPPSGVRTVSAPSAST